MCPWGAPVKENVHIGEGEGGKVRPPISHPMLLIAMSEFVTSTLLPPPIGHMIPSSATSPRALPLHRAFSVFLFGGEAQGHRMLIQQRPLHKATFPGLWANACCSHPLVRDHGNMIGALRRRLGEELGLELDEAAMKIDEGNGDGNGDGNSDSHGNLTRLTLVGRLTYAARCPVNREWGEHELDHIYALEVVGEPKLAPREEEVAAIRWVSPSELTADIRERSADYAPWFKVALRDLILPVWTELYHHRGRHPRRQERDETPWAAATKQARILHYGELS